MLAAGILIFNIIIIIIIIMRNLTYRNNVKQTERFIPEDVHYGSIYDRVVFMIQKIKTTLNH